MKSPFRISLFAISLLLVANPVFAQTVPFEVAQAVVKVRCGSRGGSGVVINGQKGYVLTNAHVLIDLTTLLPSSCTVGFIRNPNEEPSIFYRASWVRFVFNEDLNRDFAILQIGNPVLNSQTLSAFPSIKTDEFSREGDPISVLAFPSVAQGLQLQTTGTIIGLDSGLVRTNAEISPGASGGAGLNNDNHLTGIATRILYSESPSGVQTVVDYELVDIRAVINWMDTFGPDASKEYVIHANPERYYGPQGYITYTNLQCTLLAKTTLSDAVFCLRSDGTRTVFPNAATFVTWFNDFSGVTTVPPEQLAPYRLVGSVTMKPGSLVKIQTDPKTYLVTDINGTMRWMQNESVAKELYGDGWAGFVKDVPDEYFATYRLGAPINPAP